MHKESLRQDFDTMDTYEHADSPDTKSCTNIKEEQASSDELLVEKEPSKKRRYRASVACTSCRDRRIRCVVPAGRRVCTQCERSSTSCIIKDDDERRRPISRAYVYSLVDRIALLERLLEDQGLPVPPADHPPESHHRYRGNRNTSSSDDALESSSIRQDSPTSSGLTASSPCTSSVDSDCGRAGKKRRRNDSLIAPTNIKIEPSPNRLIESTLQSSNSHEVDQFAPIPRSTETFIWPTIPDHIGYPTQSCSATQITSNQYSGYSAWINNAFDPEGYTSHLIDMRFEEVLHSERQNDTIGIPRHGVTNLDFMHLDRNVWLQ